VFSFFKVVYTSLLAYLSHSQLSEVGASLSSFQLNHIQVVEGHVMSVTTEDVHDTARVDAGGVSVSGCGLAVLFEAGNLHGRNLLGNAGSLVLGDQFAVCLEALVSVLDYERIFHTDASGGAEALLVGFSFLVASTGTLHSGVLLGGALRWCRVHHGGLATSERSIVLEGR